MNLFPHWRNRVWHFILRRFFRLREVEEFVSRTGERYLDAKGWASMRGISENDALAQLTYGVNSGRLERCYLYEWSDSPVAFIVPESSLGQSVRLSDIGYIGEDDWREIYVSPTRVRTVFIATKVAA